MGETLVGVLMTFGDRQEKRTAREDGLTSTRRPDLQGMRAVAVLAVFANHLFNWPSGGFVGVDVFFVLSGFFITGLLIRERTTTRKLSFQGFYIRRVKRILPSAVLVLIVTVILSYLLFPATRAKATLLDALYAAVFASNFRFEATGADYFQQGQPPSPLQHYWSLSIEEQFYFVWPAVLVLLFALTRRFRRGGNTWAHQWGLFAAMAIVVAASFGWAMFRSAVDPNGAYFSTLTRVWELGIGALMAIAGPWLARIPTTIRPTLAYVGLAGVLGSLFLIDSTVRFPAPWAALPVLSTALVVASFHDAQVRGMSPLTNSVAAYFGDTSYTLYLWHWPVITLLLTLMPRGPLFYALALALAVGLTAVTYHYYENPVRKSDWLLEKAPATEDRRLPTLGPSGWAVIGVLAVVVVVMAIIGIGYKERLSAAQEEIAAAQRSAANGREALSAAPTFDPCFGAPAMVTPGCVLRNSDVPLQPSIDTFAKDLQRQDSCDKARPCESGYEGDDAVRIALVGDSHAQAFLPALWPILEANKWKLTAYVGFQCVLEEPPAKGCEEGLPAVKSALLAKPYDLVIITNFDPGNVAVENYQAAWEPISKAGSRIVVVRDNPATSAEALACLTSVTFGGDQSGECGTPRAEAVHSKETLPAAAQSVPDATLLDLTRYYCTADRCPSVIGNVIVYRDVMAGGNSHITATFAQTLAPAVEDALKRVLGKAGQSAAVPTPPQESTATLPTTPQESTATVSPTRPPP